MFKFSLIIFTSCIFIVSAANARQKVLGSGDYHCGTRNNVEFCVYSDNTPLTGKISVLGENGVVSSLINYKNGYRSGLSTVFNEKGQLVSRTYYKEGQKNGSERLYYDNRTIKTVVNYKDGELDGRLDHYTPEGKLLGRVTYKNGRVVQGYCISYSGTKKEKTELQNLQNYGYNQIISCGEK